MARYWIVEIKSTDGWDDYGSTHFKVRAESYKEAWKEALKLEDLKNIIRVY